MYYPCVHIFVILVQFFWPFSIWFFKKYTSFLIFVYTVVPLLKCLNCPPQESHPYYKTTFSCRSGGLIRWGLLYIIIIHTVSTFFSVNFHREIMLIQYCYIFYCFKNTIFDDGWNYEYSHLKYLLLITTSKRPLFHCNLSKKMIYLVF
jgi:hypothetical protein